MLSNNDTIPSPHNYVVLLAQKFILSRVIILFADVRLDTCFEHGPVPLANIAEQLNVNSSALRRFLRLLSAHHIIEEIETDLYSPTALCDELSTIANQNLILAYQEFGQITDELLHTEKATWHHNYGIAFENYLQSYLTLNHRSNNQNKLIIYAHEFILAKVIMVAAQLQLEDAFQNKANMSMSQVQEFLNIPLSSVKPFIDILSQHNIVNVNGNLIEKTTRTKCLNRILSPHILDGYAAFNEVFSTLKNNHGTWNLVYGAQFYDYLNLHPHKLKAFKDWCLLSASDWLPPVLEYCQFGRQKNIVDIGGGTGHFISEVLKQNPTMHGTLFDQPSVIAGVEISGTFNHLAERIKFIAGDFFQKIPSGYNVYTICRTLLNWSDEDAIKILNNCSSASHKNSNVYIIDFLIPHRSHPTYPIAVMNDISLFVIFDSGIRTEHEWRNLVTRSSLTVESFVITGDDIKPEPYYPLGIIKCKNYIN